MFPVITPIFTHPKKKERSRTETKRDFVHEVRREKELSLCERDEETGEVTKVSNSVVGPV